MNLEILEHMNQFISNGCDDDDFKMIDEWFYQFYNRFGYPIAPSSYQMF